jgi:hypothetical protein
VSEFCAQTTPKLQVSFVAWLLISPFSLYICRERALRFVQIESFLTHPRFADGLAILSVKLSS